MIQFTYSFCMAMLHSLWQAALLVLLYFIVDKLTHKNNAPLAKRNFLFIAITGQLILFAVTFSVYFFSNKGAASFTGTLHQIADSFGYENVKLATPWIFSLYVFIITGKLVKAVYSWYRFKHQYRLGLIKPGVDLKLFTQLKAHQFGIRRKVTLWLSNSVQIPLTFGYFKPVILLPVALVNQISIKQAETLILHELTHIRTHDYLLNWLLVITETIFFFNPFVTGLCKKIRLEREKHCDISVMSFEYPPALYAETLLLAERMKQLTPVFQLAAVNSKRHLLQRIRFFTSDKIVNQRLHFNIVAPLIGLALLFMLSAAILFQSAGTVTGFQPSASIDYLPTDNYIISETGMPVFTNNDIVKSEKTDDQIPVPALVDAATSTIEPAPACEPTPSLPDASEAETVTPLELNFAKPMANAENDASRQIIVTEEGSGGAVTVKVYNLSFRDGKWILQPELVMASKSTTVTDSAKGKSDSSVKKTGGYAYPAQQ